MPRKLRRWQCIYYIFRQFVSGAYITAGFRSVRCPSICPRWFIHPVYILPASLGYLHRHYFIIGHHLDKSNAWYLSCFHSKCIPFSSKEDFWFFFPSILIFLCPAGDMTAMNVSRWMDNFFVQMSNFFSPRRNNCLHLFIYLQSRTNFHKYRTPH